MFKPKLITEPAHRLITTEDAKKHLVIDYDDDDTLIEGLVLAAEKLLDGYNGQLRRCIVNQVWQESFGSFQDHMRLTFPDVNDVTKIVIKYIDSEEVEQTYDGSFELYEDAISSIIHVKTFPSVSGQAIKPITIDYQAGFGDNASKVPHPIIVAAKMLVAHWYENRGATTADRLDTLPIGVEALIRGYRRYV